MDNDGVRVEKVEACILCGAPGQTLYGAHRDRLFNAPGAWSHLSCRECGLVWLNPQPVAADIPKLYANYATHGPEASAISLSPNNPGLRHKVLKFVQAAYYGYATKDIGWLGHYFGRVVGLLSLVRDWAGSALMFLPRMRGRLMDVGCGDGRFLAAMREEGWQVLGVEPDPEAAHRAREQYHIEVGAGTLGDAAFPGNSVDAITMHHVIEHVPDPVALFRECGRILRPGGSLVVITPNVESLGHRRFGENWRGLEPPRHIFLFSRGTLGACAQISGLEIVSLRTMSRLGREIHLFSVALSGTREHLPRRVRFSRADRLRSWVFLLVEEVVRLLNGKAGEEVVLIARRPS